MLGQLVVASTSAHHQWCRDQQEERRPGSLVRLPSQAQPFAAGRAPRRYLALQACEGLTPGAPQASSCRLRDSPADCPGSSPGWPGSWPGFSAAPPTGPWPLPPGSSQRHPRQSSGSASKSRWWTTCCHDSEALVTARQEQGAAAVAWPQAWGCRKHSQCLRRGSKV